MDNPAYVSLTRQSGLMHEMRAIANNLANISTTGFRKEGVVFAEHVSALGGAEPSLSMAADEGRMVNLAQGALTQTGGALDLAIEGEGFFLIETPEGNQLTRAGNFTASPEGEIVTEDGYRLLDIGGAPVAIPPDGGRIAIAGDGTVSSGGVPFAQIGLFAPTQASELEHAAGTRFRTATEPQPVEGAQIFQGFLEGSNVAPVLEIARMIEVQRAYEMGQGFLDREDTRIRNVIQALGR